MKFLALIPARYASTRFPGKPLASIFGKPMIRHVWERTSAVFDRCAVATDDPRIARAAEGFGARAVMTSTEHRSGTDRCYEALRKLEAETGERYDVVVNVQGDEPFVNAEQLTRVRDCFADPDTDIATLVKPFSEGEDIFNPNSPKVVLSASGHALYFSRSPIPFIRSEAPENWSKAHRFYKHIGLYAYRSEVLRRITALEPGELEKAESLEQLRWLENGYRIKAAVTERESYAVDTPEDLKRVEALFAHSSGR